MRTAEDTGSQRMLLALQHLPPAHLGPVLRARSRPGASPSTFQERPRRRTLGARIRSGELQPRLILLFAATSGVVAVGMVLGSYVLA